MMGGAGDLAGLVTLAELTDGWPGTEIRGDPTTLALDLSAGVGAVRRGSIYFALRHGQWRERAEKAVASGAAAIVTETWLDLRIPQVRVPSVRAAMGPFSAVFFGHPARALSLIGVTGTNGKTTTAFMVERALEAAGLRAGLIGTVENHLGSEPVPSLMTTPEAPTLQRLLARMRDAGLAAAALEVSSHGLAELRVDGCRFACAAFTNLSRDHLDAHGTMERYYTIKSRLFEDTLSAVGVCNLDDPYGLRLAREARITTVGFAVERSAAVRATNVHVGRRESTFVVRAPNAEVHARVRLPGRLNVENALAVFAIFHALGLPLPAAAEGIEALDRVPGRFEPIETPGGALVLVDVARTADGLEAVLRAARELTGEGGRLICVFGCPGDHDVTKRAEMGAVSGRLADATIITSDSSRSEDPDSILRDIERDIRGTGARYEIVPERRDAIRNALESAGPGDVVLLAGRGLRRRMRIGDRLVPFDDAAVVRELVSE